MVQKKAGRPTNNPKKQSLHVRLDHECENILNEYCSQEGVAKAEGIRIGIKKLKDDIKK